MALINLTNNGMQESGNVKDKKIPFAPWYIHHEGYRDLPKNYAFVQNCNSKKLNELFFEHDVTMLQTKGNFAMHDLLLHLVSLHLKKSSCAPDVWLTTFSMTEMSANVVGKLKVDKMIGQLSILMDKESRTRYAQVDQILSNISDHYVLTHIHAKVLIVSSQYASHTVIGSANWTKNPRIECLTVFKNNVDVKNINWINDEIKIAYDRE